MTITTVAIKDLNTDYSYQRQLNEKRARKIEKEFSPQYVGVIVVSKREDGSLWIIDGNTRVHAMRNIGKKYVQASIVEGMSLNDEAALFAQLNTSQQKPKFIEILKARILAGDEEAIRYKNVLDRSGVRYYIGSGSKTPETFISHSLGLRLMKRDGEQALLDTLRIANAAACKMDSRLISGIATFIKYAPYDRDRLIRTLRMTPFEDLVRASSSMTIGFFGGAQVENIPMAKAIAVFYNKSLKKGRVDLSAFDKGYAEEDLA